MAVDVRELYNLASEQYARYADGDPDRLFAFDGLLPMRIGNGRFWSGS